MIAIGIFLQLIGKVRHFFSILLGLSHILNYYYQNFVQHFYSDFNENYVIVSQVTTDFTSKVFATCDTIKKSIAEISYLLLIYDLRLDWNQNSWLNDFEFMSKKIQGEEKKVSDHR